MLTSAGLTSDPIGRFIKKTALNPAFTIAFLLLARYTKKGSDLAILHETAYSRIRKLFFLGLARWASNYLDAGVLDNWTADTYDWNKEIVLITGGAGGIGGNVVKLLAERGIKVVVLDVIPMTFEARKSGSRLGFILQRLTKHSIKRLLLQVRHHISRDHCLCGSRSPEECRRAYHSHQQCWRS